MFVMPKRILSPISGTPITPKIVTRDYQGKIYTEAHYYDPNSGMFIHKGIISIKDKETGQETNVSNAKI